LEGCQHGDILKRRSLDDQTHTGTVIAREEIQQAEKNVWSSSENRATLNLKRKGSLITVPPKAIRYPGL
jgi:hypothetical protein